MSADYSHGWVAMERTPGIPSATCPPSSLATLYTQPFEASSPDMVDAVEAGIHTGRQLSGEDKECYLGQHYDSTQRNHGTHRPDRWTGLAQGEDRTKTDPLVRLPSASGTNGPLLRECLRQGHLCPLGCCSPPTVTVYPSSVVGGSQPHTQSLTEEKKIHPQLLPSPNLLVFLSDPGPVGLLGPT